jgi:hypothetical protein
MIGAARKPETQVPETKDQPPPPGPVASGPNSVPNTKPREPRPAPFQDRNPKGNPSVLNTGQNHTAAIR